MKYRGIVLNNKRIIVTSNLNNIRHDEVGIKEEDNGRFYLYEIDKFGNLYNMGPNGVLNIEKNGEYNIRDYSKVIVNIPEPTPPTDILHISEDGTYPCAEYGEVDVVVNYMGELSIGTGDLLETIDTTHYNVVNYHYNSDYGTLDINTNGPYDTRNYSGVFVNVMPEYDIYDINNDGTYEVSQYRTANVSVNYLGTTSFGTGSNCTTVDVTNYHSIDCYYDDNNDLGQLTITENGIYDTTNYSSVDVNVSSGSSNNDYLPLSKLGAVPFMVDISVYDKTSDKHIEIIDGVIINSAIAFDTIDTVVGLMQSKKGINVYVGPNTTTRKDGGYDLLELLTQLESMITAGTYPPLYIIKNENEDKYNFSNYIFYYDESTDLSSRSEEEIKWNGINSLNRIYGMFYNNILYVNQ